MPTPYGMFAAAGCITAVLWLKGHRVQMGLTENAFWAGVWTMVLGATVGAKALFVALGWEHYARGDLRLWADFGVGFVFFGGLLGAAMAGGVFAWLRGVSFVGRADYFAVAVPIGHAIGRMGCFVTGCCAGLPPHRSSRSAGFGVRLCQPDMADAGLAQDLDRGPGTRMRPDLPPARHDGSHGPKGGAHGPHDSP